MLVKRAKCTKQTGSAQYRGSQIPQHNFSVVGCRKQMEPRFSMPLASRNPRSVRWKLKDRSRSSYKSNNFSVSEMCRKVYTWISMRVLSKEWILLSFELGIVLYARFVLQTWFPRIPYPKNRVRTTCSNQCRTFTSNVNAVEGFPRILSTKEIVNVIK